MDVLYEDKFWRVTPTTLEEGGTTYPIRSIASISAPTQVPFEFFGGFLLNGALFLFGLWCIFQFSIGWFIGGLVAAGIGGFNVWGQFNRGYVFIITLADGKDIFVRKDKKDTIYNLYAAIRQALAS